jgi:hypothetical protein
MRKSGAQSLVETLITVGDIDTAKQVACGLSEPDKASALAAIAAAEAEAEAAEETARKARGHAFVTLARKPL